MTPPLGSVRPSASGCNTGKLIPAKCGIQHLVQYRPCRSDNLTQLLCELSPSNLSSEKDVISGARNNPPLGLHASMLVIKTRAGCSACFFSKKRKKFGLAFVLRSGVTSTAAVADDSDDDAVFGCRIPDSRSSRAR